MSQNNPSTLCAFDCIRLMALQRWCTTLEQVSDVHPGIVALARAEAGRRYKDLENRTNCVISPSLEDVSEAIEAWAIWQAFILQVSNPEHCPIGVSGIYSFTRDLEQILEQLTTDRTHDLFIL